MYPRKKISFDSLEGPVEGEETEAEKQLKLLHDKQMSTSVKLDDILKQKQDFVSATKQVDFTKKVKRQSSLSELKDIKNELEEIESLQKFGLTDDEIEIYLSVSKPKKKKKRLFLNPRTVEEQYDVILKKIDKAKHQQSKTDTFKGSKILTRQEMDIEDSLYAGSKRKSSKMLPNLVRKEEDDVCVHPEDPINHLDEIMDKMFDKKVSKIEKSEILERDMAMYSVVVPIPMDEIENNKLSLKQLKDIDRFKNYVSGKPSKTLFLKNLHQNTTLQELMSLFNNFEEDNSKDSDMPINYRLLKGKMKGQAFITFPNEKLATSAFNAINGYKLRGKPIVIQYGRK